MLQIVKKRLFNGILVLMLLICMCSVSVDATNSENAAADCVNGVAMVYSEFVGGNGGFGSAFGIGTVGENTDMFITNKHVVCSQETNGWQEAKGVYLILDEDVYNVTQYIFYDLEGNEQIYDSDVPDTSQMVKCDVIYVSEDYDFAIIKTQSPVDRIALELASSAESVKQGNTVFALGYPGLSAQIAGTNMEETDIVLTDGVYKYPVYRYTETRSGRTQDVTVTTGTVSRFTEMADENNVKTIQHDATIHPGNSGGPLITADGKVLGINTYGYNDESIESFNYAIYIDYVRDYLDEAGIPYNITTAGATTTTSTSSGIPWGPIIVVIAVIVVAAVVIFVMRSRRPAGATNNAQGSRPVQTNPGNQAGRQFGGASGKNGSVPRFCPHCGAPLNDDAKFCGNCGKPVS